MGGDSPLQRSDVHHVLVVLVLVSPLIFGNFLGQLERCWFVLFEKVSTPLHIVQLLAQLANLLKFGFLVQILVDVDHLPIVDALAADFVSFQMRFVLPEAVFAIFHLVHVSVGRPHEAAHF